MPEFTVDASDRSPDIPAPATPAITWRGKDITPAMILDLWRDAARAKRNSRSRILSCRRMRRKDASSKVKVSSRWARKFPEAAAVASLAIEERVTLERNLIAAVGAVEPEYEREPLGFLDTDRDNAEACQSMLNEWRLRCVPTPSMVGKNAEDGEFALLNLPCDIDLEGCKDYFEYLDEAAHEELPDDEKASYTKDDDDRRGRYVKRDRDGRRAVRPEYAKYLTEPDDDKKKPSKEREAAKDERHKAAQAAHQEDVAQYILRKQLDASAVRLIPALDCAPVFKRGRRRERFELVALVERVLYEPWDLLDAKDGYRWVGMGDRAMIPQAFRDDGSPQPEGDIGTNGQVYVYTAYLSSKDDKGRSHLLICTTIGGAGTWDGASGTENNTRSVSVIDLFEEYGIEGESGGLWPFVTYHGGLRTEDDDSDHYWQPYLWALIDRIKAIEAMSGAVRVATVLNSFTGYYHSPDPRWAATEEGAEVLLESDGNLRSPRVPGTGEIEDAVGTITPAQQAQVGQDAWRMLEYDRAALAEATAIDQIPSGSSQSGHALLVQSTLGQVAKRHLREGVLGAVVAAGEAQLRIWNGIYERYKIRWPVRTVQEKPVKGETREGRAPAMFDPEWVKDGQFNLAASYPEEENLARIDLEASLADRGYGSYDDVQRARGKSNADNERLKSDRDRLLKTPQADALRMVRVAKKIGDRDLEKIAQLQADELMAPMDVPGIPGGVPTAALGAQGQQMAQGGGQGIAGKVRAGVEGAQQSGDMMAANAQAAISGAAA